MKKIIFIFIVNRLPAIFLVGSLLIVNCSAQWYKQPIPVNKPITGIKFVDTSNGWASTGNYSNPTPQDTGFIFHTTNGGTNWFVQFYKKGYEFSTMTMVNNLIGYAAIDSIAQFTNWPFLLKTTNGGINWFNIPVPYNMSIDQFYFLSSDTGWEVANAGIGPDVRVTTDGGTNWQVRTNGITSETSCIFFLNYDTGFCGSSNMIFKTTNAGLNWFQIGNFSANNINSIFFYNDKIGWTGMSYDSIAYTSNGGLNWVYQIKPIHQGPISFYFFDSLKGWGGTGFEQILKTINGGLNWGYQIDSGWTEHLSFIDSSKGWTGSVLGIYKTTNGGGSISYIGIINISNEIPEQYKLFQNFPNPFNPSTKIRFSLVKASYVQIKIFDVSGRELNPWIFGWYPETLLQAGTHEFQFDGSEMASGVYFFKLIVTDGAKTSNKLYESIIKMLLVK